MSRVKRHELLFVAACTGQIGAASFAPPFVRSFLGWSVVMSKRILSLLIVAGVFSAVAVGCGSDPAPADDDDTTTTKKDSGAKKKATKTDDTGTDDTNTGDDDDDDTSDSGSISDSGVAVKKDSGSVKPPDDSGTLNPPPIDSGVVSDAGSATDSGTTPPPPACYTQTEVTNFTAFTFPTGHAHQAGKCTSAQITAIANACGSELSGGTGSCYSTTKAQPAACSTCAWTSFSAGQTVANTGPFYDDGANADINIAGCIDIATGTAGCGSKAYNYIACLSAACATCGDADIDACSDQASIDGCVAKSGLDSACVTAYNANGTAAAACFPPGGAAVAAEWASWTNSIVSAFCK